MQIQLRNLLPTFCLMALFAQGIFCILDKSPTCDEFAHHTASGFSHLVTGDFRMNPAAPPVPRLLSAIPLYFYGAKAPLDHWSWKKGDSPEFARQFFYHSNDDQDALIFLARLPILLIGLFFAYFVYVWAKELWGFEGGLCALLLFCFCPDIVAHSSIATSDICVSFFFFMALWRFSKYLNKPTLKNIALTGVFTGLCFLSKFSAVLLFPIILFIAVLSKNFHKLSFNRSTLFLLVTFLVIWAGYFFEIKPLLTHTPDPAKKVEFLKKMGGDELVDFARNVPVPLATFTTSFGSMMFTRAKGTNSFLMGQWSATGWWYYYFVAFCIKNTIPLLLLFLSSLVLLPKLKINRTTKLLLCLPIALFFMITLRDKAQAGIRYFFPVYPLVMILAAGAFAYLWNKNKKWLKGLLAALLLWHVSECVLAAPNQFSYFNEFIGGPSNGYHYLRDSNVDWGQDLKGACKYLKSQGIDDVVLFTISPVDIAYYGIKSTPMSTEECVRPLPRVYVLGVHGIDKVLWSAERKPVKIVGHSVFIYDLRSP